MFFLVYTFVQFAVYMYYVNSSGGEVYRSGHFNFLRAFQNPQPAPTKPSHTLLRTTFPDSVTT